MTTAIIAPTVRQARHFMQSVGLCMGNAVIPMAPGSATVGRMLDNVVMVEWRPGDGLTHSLAKMGQDWYDCSIRTKRPPGWVDTVLYIPASRWPATLGDLTGSNADDTTALDPHSTDDHDEQRQ